MPSTATSKPLVIIPSENQTREFDAKLLLACELAQRGFEVVVGARHEIHNKIARFRPGIYIAKDFRKPSERILKIIAGLGHHIVAWDEEGLVQPQPQLYYERRWSLPAIKNVKEVFAWGPANERLMLGAPSWPGIKIHRTGNPRLDLLRPELRGFYDAEVAALRNQHGRYILFNSNFASFNPAITSIAPVMGNTGTAKSPYLTWRGTLFEHWKNLLPHIAEALPEIAIVVRPHPAEAHALWRDIARPLPNMKVIHDGSAIPWILASEVLLHSGCTTGVEAFFLGKPAISLRPNSPLAVDQDMPDLLSEMVETEEQLLAALKQRFQNPTTYVASAKQVNAASEAAFGQKGPLAVELIADVIETIRSTKSV